MMRSRPLSNSDHLKILQTRKEDMLKSLKSKGRKWALKGTYRLGKLNGYLEAKKELKKKNKKKKKK